MQVSKIGKSRFIKKCGIVIGLASIGTGAIAIFISATPAHASSAIVPPSYEWRSHKALGSFDHPALRRGFQVYKQVCAACHSLNYTYYRHLIGNVLTLEEAKEYARESTIIDGPDDEGKMYERPRIVTDLVVAPYKNEAEAKAANGGALPPEMTNLAYAREYKEDYIFQLMTSYCDPPAGVILDEGLHYNPYMSGGRIGMARPLYDGMIEYEDGTPATTSQMAKDVAHFLQYVADMDLEDRKRNFFKLITGLGLLIPLVFILKRHTWYSLWGRINRPVKPHVRKPDRR